MMDRKCSTNLVVLDRHAKHEWPLHCAHVTPHILRIGSPYAEKSAPSPLCRVRFQCYFDPGVNRSAQSSRGKRGQRYISMVSRNDDLPQPNSDVVRAELEVLLELLTCSFDHRYIFTARFGIALVHGMLKHG